MHYISLIAAIIGGGLGFGIAKLICCFTGRKS